MDEEVIERLTELADDVVNDIDDFVPVVGNLLYTYKDGSELYANFSSFIDKNVNDYAFNKKASIIIQDLVIDFLEKGKFKLILTTSPFDVLDRALKEKGVPVKSYYHRWGQEDSTNMITRVKDEECIQFNGSNKEAIKEEDTLVYHLLGGYKTNSLPKSEREFLECLLSYQIGKANSLPAMLSRKQILLLGSGIPNWLFLLLWYPLMRTSGIRYLFNHDYEENQEFQTCLNSLNFKNEEAMNKFLDIAINKLSLQSKVNITQRSFEYDVFLSYKSEDQSFADKIYKHLTEECQLKVWYMDARQETSSPGEFYKRLSEGISQSRTFMPIVGKHYIARFVEFKTDPRMASVNPLLEDLGVIRETYMALEMKNSILASNGLGFYEIPVWDMDDIDPQQQKFMQNVLDSLGVFQKIIKYSYTEERRKIKEYMDFMSMDWSEIFN